MAEKFHVNGAGEAGPCGATTEDGCPFGGADSHYSSKEEAREAYEAEHAEESLPGVSRKRSSTKRAEAIEDVRDRIEAAEGKLTDTAARKLFEGPYKDSELAELDNETRRELFDTTLADVEAAEGRKSWNSAFNEYAARMELAREARTATVADEDPELGEYGSQVLNSGNRLSMVFHLFRQNPGMSDTQAKDVLEGAYPTALSSYDRSSRDKVFEYANDRGSADGWAQVAEEYSKGIDVFSRFRLAPGERSK